MKPKASLRTFLALSGSAMLVVNSANATQFWDGTGLDDNWNNPANWGGDLIPAFGTTAINFGSLSTAAGTAFGNVVVPTQTTADNDLPANTGIKGITFGNTGVANRTAAYTLTGNSIILGTGTNDGISTAVIAAGGAAIQDLITLDIDLGSGTGTQNRVFNTGTNHNLKVDGVISGTSTTWSLMKQGLGTLTLTSANNSYLAPTNIAGTTASTGNSVLEVTKLADSGFNSSIGAAGSSIQFSLAVNGAHTNTLRHIGSTDSSTNRGIHLGGNTGSSVATNSAIESSGDGTLSFTSSSAITFTNSGVPRNLYLGGTNAGANVFNMALSDNGAGLSTITKQGDGKWILSGTSTYTGATLVSAGTLLVNGALGNTEVTVNGGAFGGSGTIGSTLSLLGGSLYVADLSDALQVASTVSIYAGFGVDDLAGLTWGSVADGTYMLINGTLGAGVFAGLANNSPGTAFDLGGGRNAYFTESSLNLVVQTIPEPSAALLGALGFLALLRRRR